MSTLMISVLGVFIHFNTCTALFLRTILCIAYCLHLYLHLHWELGLDRMVVRIGE